MPRALRLRLRLRPGSPAGVLAAAFAGAFAAAGALGAPCTPVDEAAVDAAVRAAVAADAALPPPAGRARRFLDCDGLGEGHEFWAEFRRAFATEGPLGVRTLDLAYHKWFSWLAHCDELEEAGLFDGRMWIPSSSTTVIVRDRLQIVEALRHLMMDGLMGNPPHWGPTVLCGFLACPVGFLLVQFVIFMTLKVRTQPAEEVQHQNWQSISETFSILGMPSYALDHLESSGWNISSFDIAVNLHNHDDKQLLRYETVFDAHPVPPPRLASWRREAPWLANAAADSLRSPGSLRLRLPFCRRLGAPVLGGHVDRDLRSDGSFRVALVGEHGGVNVDQHSTLVAAARASCGEAGSAGLEVANFFTYAWHLKGTKEGGGLQASLRMTWEAFWGMPLTASMGRQDTDTPPWTLERAVQALRGFASREPFLRSARLVVCCEPMWLCILLHAARGALRLLVRVSMCLLTTFRIFFGNAALPHFWPLVRSFATDLPPRGMVSAHARISAEMLAFQTGVRAPYVPALGLHVGQEAPYAPASAAVLLFRCQLPGAVGFRRLLELLLADLPPSRPGPTLVDMGPTPLSYREIAAFRAVAMFPHVPYALRLAEVYAMGSPLLVPAEPLLHKFVWPYAGPFCGRTDHEITRSLDPDATDRSSPPYSPFDFQGEEYIPHRFHEDRRYWLQYTEWQLRPHLVRFASGPDFLERAALSEEEAKSISAKMRASHAATVEEALPYWQAAIAVAAGDAEPSFGAS